MTNRYIRNKCPLYKEQRNTHGMPKNTPTKTQERTPTTPPKNSQEE